MAILVRVLIFLILASTPAFGMNLWEKCLVELRQLIRNGSEQRVRFRHPLRLKQFLAKIPDPATSPILRAVFPEAYADGYDQHRLLEGIDLFFDEGGERARNGEDSPRIGAVVSEFFGRLETVAATQTYLKKSPSFREFLAVHGGKNGINLLDSSTLDSFLRGDGWSRLRSELPNIYLRGIIAEFSDAEIAKSDEIARRLMAETPASDGLIAYAGLVERYREHLHAKGEWDPALDLNGPGVKLGKYPPNKFLGKKLRVGKEVWGLDEFIGSGGENFVFRARNTSTGQSKILKITNPRAAVNPELIHVLRQRIENAGLPVVKMENLGPHFNFVEEIKYFGSDVVSEYLERGTSAEIEPMKVFYRNLLDSSTLRLQDIKPGNVGKRANGTWVITDWAFNLGFRQKELPLEGKIDPKELGMQLCKGAWEAYSDAVRTNPSRKSIYADRALAFAREMIADLKIKDPPAYLELKEKLGLGNKK